MAELIPGLAIEVKGTTDGDKLIARTIKYSKDDLRTANVIQAGLAPTQQHVAANTEAISTNKGNIAANREQIGANKQQIETNQEEVEQRFADLADYEMRGSTVVYFAPGKTILSKESKAALLELANKASGLQGYLLEVKGFADSSGDPAQNQVLSRKRAEAVIDFLHQQAKIPVRHVLAPGAMGVTEPAASNEDTSGRSANRRVEVKVLVNRGLAASAK